MDWISDKVDKLAPALLEAQKAIRGAKKDAENPFLKNKYADLASVFEAVKKPLNEQGIIIIQGMGAVDGKTTMTTVLMHTSGQFIAAEGFLPPIDPKGINAAQAMGSAISYMKRYQLQAIAGCVGDGEDDDGQAAGSSEPPPAPLTLNQMLDKMETADNQFHMKKRWDNPLFQAGYAKLDKKQKAVVKQKKDDMKVVFDLKADSQRGEG
jgi:hypothetical protein